MLALGFVAGSGCLEITKAKQILEDGEEEQPKKEKERKKERKKLTVLPWLLWFVSFSHLHKKSQIQPQRAAQFSKSVTMDN